MINLGKSFNLREYIEILMKRKWYVLIPLAVALMAAVFYIMTTPRKYLATTTILVTPQKVPEDYVRSTITMGIEARFKSISQEIMSRTRLEKIITEFNLYSEEARHLKQEEIVERMRENIWIKLGGKEGHFSISYIGEDPKTVTIVANKLASLYIEENLRMREQQAQGTTEFLSNELNMIRAKLEEQEKSVINFKKQHLYELPEQVTTNLSVLGQLQRDHERISNNLKAAQERKLIIQKQLSEMKMLVASIQLQESQKEEISHPTMVENSPQSSSSTLPKLRMGTRDDAQLNQLKNHLLELQAKYTEKHPDILAAKKKISELEKKIEKLSTDGEEAENAKGEQVVGRGVPSSTSKKIKREEKPESETDFFYKELENQLVATELEVQRLKEEESKIRIKIATYQVRVENAPTLELNLVSLNRDYNNTKEIYNTVLKNSLSAQQAENLERRQKGEQFKVLDPARIPEKPFKPNRPKILAFGFLLGISLGAGAAFVKEQSDRSFREIEDMEATLGLKVLATIPNLKREERKAA